MTDPVFLLDTNICIYILANGSGRAALRLAEQSPGSVVTSTICQAEIMMGAARHPAAGLGHFFNAVPALPFDEAAAVAYAGLPFRRGSFDRLIAAHSLSRALILVTANPRDFVDLPGLCIEDWTQP